MTNPVQSLPITSAVASAVVLPTAGTAFADLLSALVPMASEAPAAVPAPRLIAGSTPSAASGVVASSLASGAVPVPTGLPTPQATAATVPANPAVVQSEAATTMGLATASDPSAAPPAMLPVAVGLEPAFASKVPEATSVPVKTGTGDAKASGKADHPTRRAAAAATADTPADAAAAVLPLATPPNAALIIGIPTPIGSAGAVPHSENDAAQLGVVPSAAHAGGAAEAIADAALSDVPQQWVDAAALSTPLLVPDPNQAVHTDKATGDSVASAPAAANAALSAVSSAASSSLSLASSSQATTSAGASSSADPPTALARQIAPALVQLAHGASGTAVVVRLDPVGLGHVQVRIERDVNGGATVQVVAERPETLRLLVADQPHLHSVLDGAGVSTDGRVLSFELATPGSGTSSESGSGANGGRTGQGRNSRTAAISAGSDDDSSFAAQPTWLRAGVDITA